MQHLTLLERAQQNHKAATQALVDYSVIFDQFMKSLPHRSDRFGKPEYQQMSQLIKAQSRAFDDLLLAGIKHLNDLATKHGKPLFSVQDFNQHKYGDHAKVVEMLYSL